MSIRPGSFLTPTFSHHNPVSYLKATTSHVNIPKRVTWNSSCPETVRNMSSLANPNSAFLKDSTQSFPKNGLFVRLANAFQAGVQDWQKSGNPPYPIGKRFFSQELKDGFTGNYYHGTSLSRVNSHDPSQLVDGELRAGGEKFVGSAQLAGFYAKTKENEEEKDAVILELAHGIHDYPVSDEMHPYFTGPAQILNAWELSEEYRSHAETYPNMRARVISACTKGFESF